METIFLLELLFDHIISFLYKILLLISPIICLLLKTMNFFSMYQDFFFPRNYRFIRI